jgi:hypothetical protein
VTPGPKLRDSRAAARDRSSLITSDGAGADEEQQPDVGAALEEARDDAVELLVDVGQAREVALLDDRGREARLGKDHHPGGRLDQMRAGARADDEEECVLDLSV